MPWRSSPSPTVTDVERYDVFVVFFDDDQGTRTQGSYELVTLEGRMKAVESLGSRWDSSGFHVELLLLVYLYYGATWRS